VARWLLPLLSVAALAVPATAEAKRCGKPGKTIAKLGATRVFAKHHSYYACQRGRTRFLWSGRHTADEEISFGDPRTTPGGKGKNFSFYTRLDVARDEWLEGGQGKDKERIGQRVRVTTLKCKSAPQQRRAYYNIYFDKGGPIEPGGIDRAHEIVTRGQLYDLIDKSGNWYTYGDLKVLGKAAFTDALRDNAQVLQRLEGEIRQMGYGG